MTMTTNPSNDGDESASSSAVDKGIMKDSDDHDDEENSTRDDEENEKASKDEESEDAQVQAQSEDDEGRESKKSQEETMLGGSIQTEAFALLTGFFFEVARRMLVVHSVFLSPSWCLTSKFNFTFYQTESKRFFSEATIDYSHHSFTRYPRSIS
jgi:uncharacterized membrane protein YdbT with pleckstrin-like domain